MGKKVAGICYVKADDQMFTVTGGVEVPFTTKVRTPMESLSNDQGHFSETQIAPFVRLTAINDSDLDQDKIADSTNLTITAELANGKTYVLTQAYLAQETTASGDEGTVPLEFRGAKGVYI